MLTRHITSIGFFTRIVIYILKIPSFLAQLKTATLVKQNKLCYILGSPKPLIGNFVKYLVITLSILLLSSQAFTQNAQITSFSKSKKLLLKLYKDNPVTLYFGCYYKGKKPKLSSCGYIPKKNKKRANRIEWEHVVPAHAFGQSFSEWRDGHPKCVKKNGKKFKE